MNEFFIIPGLTHYLRVYIKEFHICQLHSNEKLLPRQLQNMINPNYKAMSKFGRNLKVIHRSYKDNKYILVVIDEVTNFMVTIPISQSRSEEIDDATIEHVFSKNNMLEYIIMDQDSAFMSTLINYLFKMLGIKM